MPGEPLLIFDGHLDLAYNALYYRCDLTQPVHVLREREDPVRRGVSMHPDSLKRRRGLQAKGYTVSVSLPEMRRGRVGIMLATVIARVQAPDSTTHKAVRTQAAAYGKGRAHLTYYRALERRGEITFIKSLADLEACVQAWNVPTPQTSIGLLLGMESADPILGPDQVPEWGEAGLRSVSLTHYGANTYGHGTGTEGGLLPRGRNLLKALRAARIIVDLTHTTDQAIHEILDAYDGPGAASHHNCRALVPGQRQLTDDMIRAIVARGGVIGAACDAWMRDPGWKREIPSFHQTTRATLETVADHIDHVCQVAGSARHAGIGPDLDGGHGYEQSPRDLNTVADLQKLRRIFARWGYPVEGIRNVLSGNWIRLLKEIWND